MRIYKAAECSGRAQNITIVHTTRNDKYFDKLMKNRRRIWVGVLKRRQIRDMGRTNKMSVTNLETGRGEDK